MAESGGIDCRSGAPPNDYLVSAEIRGDLGPLAPPILRRFTMRFMVMIKATQDTEAGVLPDEALLAAMGKYNEELAKAGVMLAGEGLQPSSKGARVRFSGGKQTVIDGPFTETKELIAGFWIWQ